MALPMTVECSFNNSPHTVQLALSAQGALSVSVEDLISTEKWHGSFSESYVEQLTHKSGSFKSFDTFVEMIMRALQGSSQSLQLHWLTLRDLQALQQQRAFAASHTAAHTAAHKRFLIVTYHAEFDRVHFPLPLLYAGEPESRLLIEKLREHARDRAHASMQHTRDTTHNTTHVSQAAAATAAELAQQQQENAMLRSTVQELGARLEQQRKDTAPDLQGLRELIAALERDMLEQKNKYQRALRSKAEKILALEAELEATRSSERSLQTRCRALTAELADSRKTRTRPAASSSSSRPSARTRAPVSRSRSRSAGGGHVPSRRQRSSSAERVPARSRARSSSAPRVRTRSASPAGRFDPTAYIRAREEKLRLAKERRSGSARRSRRASPSPLRSRASSREPSASPSRARTTSTSTPTRRQAPVQSPQRGRGRPEQDTRDAETSAFQSGEMAEIDARLRALQSYLNASKDST